MHGRVSYVLISFLLLNCSINAEDNSTTVSSSTLVERTTEKPVETSSNSTTTLKSLIPDVVNTTPSTDTTATLTTENSAVKMTTTAEQPTSVTTTLVEKTTEKPIETSSSSETTLKSLIRDVVNTTQNTDTTATLTTENSALETTTTDEKLTSVTTVFAEKTTEKPVETSSNSTTTLKSLIPDVVNTTRNTDTTATLTTENSALETTTTTAEQPTSVTTALESTTGAKKLEKTKSSNDNQTIKNVATNSLEIPTTEASSTVSSTNETTNVPKPSVAIEQITSSNQSHNNDNHLLHPDKPHWAYIEPSQPNLAPNNKSLRTDDFVQNVIHKIAEFITTQINNGLSTSSSSSAIDQIVNELSDKLDLSELDLSDDYLGAIRVTTKLVFGNLPVIIKAVVSNIKKIDGDKNCPIQFKFLNDIYCIKFELDLIHSLSSTTSASVPSATTSPADVSIKSLKVSNTNHVDKPPALWQQWLNPSTVSDQSSSTTTNEPAVVCYYTNWAQYRNGPGRFYPGNIDPNLCTHILYAFAQLTNGVIAPYEWNDESTQWSTGMYARMMELRKANRPKILLALGGWNHGSGKFSDMVRNETKRATFVTTTIIFLQKHKFDGLDLDWEYPGSREGSRPTDKEDYVKLIVELKKAFRPYSLLLTAAVGAGKSTITAAYDIPQVCESLDLVNLMAYDLHGSWESATGINAPLYSRPGDTEVNKELTQDWAVRHWLDNGCSKSKLVLGLPLYGRTFRLASSANNRIGAPAVGPGAAGLYTGEAGFLAYYEICTRVQQQGWTKVFDEDQKSNYAYKGQEWVGYDDTYSIGYKVQYAKDMGLAGIMFWAPDLDDFTGGLCSEGKYPLMNTAVNILRDQTHFSTSTKPSIARTTTTTAPGPTSEQRKRVVCYYTNWAQYRPEGGKFLPENLDASLCTHIIYAFAVLKDSKLTAYEWNDEDTEWSKGLYTRIMELKKTNNVKVLLAVGGWNFGSGAFSDLVGNTQLRKEFVQQATQFIRDHGFDGFDLDWEYPGSREGSRPEDKKLFTALVKELKEAVQPYNLLLTAAVGAGAPVIENGYEIDQLAEYLDFINLMTYDLHGGAWENVTGLHTALYARPGEADTNMTLNQNWAVNHWIEQGMPKEKINMGLAMYGRTFKLVNSSETYIGAPSSGPGEPGKYTREPGFLAFYEICEKLQSNLWTSKYDDVQKSMYAYGEGMWVGYDNIDTLTIRANYIIGKDLGGVMLWSPDLDDFSGKFCNRGRYPLLNTVVNLIRSNTILPLVIPTDPTPNTTVTTRKTPVFTTGPSVTTSPSPSATSPSISPSSTISSPSVVCMTTVNPFVFNTLDVNLCSHLILVQTQAILPDTDLFESALASDTLDQINQMKITNPHLKVFFSILGQWKAKHFELLRDNQQRTTFNQKLQQYLIDNHLDGFDLDWNLRAEDVSSLTDKHYLSTWLLELRKAFSANRLSLSVGISGDKTVLDNSYDFNKISNAVDFIRLMAFDWPFKNVTTLINPLYPVQKNQQNDDDQYDNINWAIDYVITLGIPPEQISLGIPTYGRWFSLANSKQNTIGSPIIGSSVTLAYSDICKLLKSTDYVNVYDKQSRSSYVYNEKKKQWISSDAITDVALKARFANLQGLGGVTLSSVGMDDVDGQCGNGPYPLLHAVADVFRPQSDKRAVPKAVDIPQGNSQDKKNVFCSVSPQAEKLSTSIPFTLSKIDTRLCTHLLIDHRSSLFSGKISDQLKNINVNLKFLLTINFIENIKTEQCQEMLRNKKADGINIHIPTDTLSNDFIEQIKKMKSILSEEYLLTLSFEIPTDPSHQLPFFNILGLHEYIDYLIILPFNGESVKNFNEVQSWNSLTSFVQANPKKNTGDFSMASALLFILSSDVPKAKIIFSIPTYGLTFLLEDENKYQLGDKILAQGFPGRVTHTVGMLASYEICKHIQSDNYERLLSNESIIVLAHEKDNLILFDDTQPLELQNKVIINGTVELKATFIKNSQLGGVLVHSIDMDDYTGLFCRRGTLPITSVVSRIFSTSKSSIETTTPANIMTTIPPKKSNLCSGVKTQDLIADENDCHYYYVCLPTSDKSIARLQCPVNMYFSARRKACIQEDSPCSSKSKSNTIEKSKVTTTTKPSPTFSCPIPDGIFPNRADCTRYFACSNNLAIPMQCPATTKFNSLLSRCDWSSDLCP